MNAFITYLLSPAVLVTVLAYCVTFVLRHRLYIYASTYRQKFGSVVHVFVIQNLEIIDLDIPLHLEISTVNNPGQIQRISMQCGKRGPLEQWRTASDPPASLGFEPDGMQRWTRVSYGMSALDTWRIACVTNDDAKEVRLVIRGWDLRRKCARWWVPTFQRGGVRITSQMEDINNLYTRPVQWIAWILIGLVVVGYFYVVAGLASIVPSAGMPFLLRQVARYIAGVSYPIRPSLDFVILGGLVVLGVLARRLVMRSHWQDVSLGYLGDPFLHQIIGDPLELPPGQHSHTENY